MSALWLLGRLGFLGILRHLIKMLNFGTSIYVIHYKDLHQKQTIFIFLAILREGEGGGADFRRKSMENPNTFSNWAPPFFISPRGILKGVIFWKLRESYKLSYVCTLNFGGLRVFGVLWVWKIIGILFSKLFWCENGSKYRFFYNESQYISYIAVYFFSEQIVMFLFGFWYEYSIISFIYLQVEHIL